jgi:twitching motility protein PilT
MLANKLFPLLGKPEVQEIILLSGKPPCAVVNGSYRRLSAQTLLDEDILAVVMAARGQEYASQLADGAQWEFVVAGVGKIVASARYDGPALRMSLHLAGAREQEAARHDPRSGESSSAHQAVQPRGGRSGESSSAHQAVQPRGGRSAESSGARDPRSADSSAGHRGRGGDPSSDARSADASAGYRGGDPSSDPRSADSSAGHRAAQPTRGGDANRRPGSSGAHRAAEPAASTHHAAALELESIEPGPRVRPAQSAPRQEALDPLRRGMASMPDALAPPNDPLQRGMASMPDALAPPDDALRRGMASMPDALASADEPFEHAPRRGARAAAAEHAGHEAHEPTARRGARPGAEHADHEAHEPAARRAARPAVAELDEPVAAPPPPKAAPPKPAPAPRPRYNGPTDALDVLFNRARDRHASDLHVLADRPAMLRIAGELVPQPEQFDADTLEQLLLPRIPERVRLVLERDGSCDFSFVHPECGRFRANVGRQRTGLKLTARPIGSEIPTLEGLGLPASIANALDHHQGLIVITGPTGHGKTTTLAALVGILNQETAHHVITVEDPIEYSHPIAKAVISQREVGTHTKTFAAALKGSLREDPDVIVVGELRDTETVRMALSASETGHLVISTMNTPSAAKAIERLIDLFPPGDQPQVRMTLAGGLRLIISQRLVPSTDRKQLVAACEVLPGSTPLWALIRENRTYQIASLQQRGRSIGIIRMDDSLAELVKTGKTSMEIAREYADSQELLNTMVQGRPQAVRADAPPENQNDPESLQKRGVELGKQVLSRAGKLFGGDNK